MDLLKVHKMKERLEGRNKATVKTAQENRRRDDGLTEAAARRGHDPFQVHYHTWRNTKNLHP